MLYRIRTTKRSLLGDKKVFFRMMQQLPAFANSYLKIDTGKQNAIITSPSGYTQQFRGITGAIPRHWF